MASLTPATLCVRDIVHQHHFARGKRRRQDLLDIGQERRPIERAVDRHRRVDAIPPQRGDERLRLPMPNGTDIRQRSPRGAQPKRRAMFVEIAVSSMNTSFDGSRSSCPSNHASRALATSSLSCSDAWPVFFLRVILCRARNRHTVHSRSRRRGAP